MSIHAEIIPPSPAGAGHPDAAALSSYAGTPSQRFDGWTADRQRVFLQALSEGSTVKNACRIAGLSEQSAYAFRRSARGASFAIGWQAAQLLCREALADMLMERALNGVFEETTYADGSSSTRHRHDNHLAFKMLNRMDRMADAAQGEATHAAARLAAAEFDQYLDMIARDGGPARAGLFLGSRLGAEGVPASADDLAPVRALARADRWLRTHTDLAEPLATADLDPANRGGWSTEQWNRAEAAGLVALAPRPVPAPDPAPQTAKHPQHINEDNPSGAPVWWDSAFEQWRTHFPPPDDFYGEEEGEYGQADYSRALSADEEAVIDGALEANVAERCATESIERDIWFGFIPDPAETEAAPAETNPDSQVAAPDPSPRPGAGTRPSAGDRHEASDGASCHAAGTGISDPDADPPIGKPRAARRGRNA